MAKKKVRVRSYLTHLREAYGLSREEVAEKMRRRRKKGPKRKAKPRVGRKKPRKPGATKKRGPRVRGRGVGKRKLTRAQYAAIFAKAGGLERVPH